MPEIFLQTLDNFQQMMSCFSNANVLFITFSSVFPVDFLTIMSNICFSVSSSAPTSNPNKQINNEVYRNRQFRAHLYRAFYMVSLWLGGSTLRSVCWWSPNHQVACAPGPPQPPLFSTEVGKVVTHLYVSIIGSFLNLPGRLWWGLTASLTVYECWYYGKCLRADLVFLTFS